MYPPLVTEDFEYIQNRIAGSLLLDRRFEKVSIEGVLGKTHYSVIQVLRPAFESGGLPYCEEAVNVFCARLADIATTGTSSQRVKERCSRSIVIYRKALEMLRDFHSCGPQPSRPQ